MTATQDEIAGRDVVFKPNPGPQTLFLAAPEREVLYGGAAGGGKAQPLWCKIATPTGWTTMGDIQVGDKVSTPDGKFATVTDIWPNGVQAIFKITTRSGRVTHCSIDHLWKVRREKVWDVLSLKQIIAKVAFAAIPVGAVNYDTTNPTAAPYRTGNHHGTVEKTFPESYFTAPLTWRMFFVQGMMDLCGGITTNGKPFFKTTNKELLAQMQTMFKSIGALVALRNDDSLWVRHADVSKLFRFTNQLRLPKKVNEDFADEIVTIEPAGEEEVKCITIDSEDQLYVTDDYIVTHNSYAILADPVRYLPHPQFSGLVLRHTTEELRELIWKSQELYPKVMPGIRWSERKMQWEHPNGGRLWMSYLDRDEDVMRYQGLSFSYVAFDELTQWRSPFAWNYMRSRLRTTAKDLPLFMRASTNPGGPGHAWVKKMFIDPAPYGKPFWATDIETGETMVYPPGHSKEGQPLFKRRFIPASLKDNPHLYDAGDYETNLLSLPEHERRRLLEGDWDVSEGAAFSEFNRAIHVVEPYHIPASWPRFRSADYGYGSWSCVLWFAIAPDDSLVVYRELYVTKVLAEDLAVMVLNAEQGEKIMYGVLDSSCWHKRGDTGPSIAERMIMKGCRWRPADRSSGSRIAGKNEVHRRLQIDPFTNAPRMVFFNNCIQVISDLPSIPLDKTNPEDVDTKVKNDHSYDALRYGVMSRPRNPGLFDFSSSATSSFNNPACKVVGY